MSTPDPLAPAQTIIEQVREAMPDLWATFTTDQRLALVGYDLSSPVGRSEAMADASETLSEAATLLARGEALMRVAIRATEATLKAQPAVGDEQTFERDASPESQPDDLR